MGLCPVFGKNTVAIRCGNSKISWMPILLTKKENALKSLHHVCILLLLIVVFVCAVLCVVKKENIYTKIFHTILCFLSFITSAEVSLSFDGWFISASPRLMKQVRVLSYYFTYVYRRRVGIVEIDHFF